MVASELVGAVWDGTDLYMIEPARLARGLLVSPSDAGDSKTLVYRLSDTQFPGNFCGVPASAMADDGSSPTGLQSFKHLVGELRATAVDLRGQLEIAVLGDTEFRAATPVDPEGALLARMNVVDGIYSEQVGRIFTCRSRARRRRRVPPPAERRLLVRWEYYPANFLGFVQLAAIGILLRQF